MAVGVLTAAPEFTKQVYDDVTEKMFGHPAPMREDESPEGLGRSLNSRRQSHTSRGSRRPHPSNRRLSPCL
jgi:hypothetical protein